MLSTKPAICFWLVDKNVFINYKPSFDIKKSWQKFYNDWHQVLDSATEPIYEINWAEFQATYENNYWIAIDYL